jgi:hypothetical protein
MRIRRAAGHLRAPAIIACMARIGARLLACVAIAAASQAHAAHAYRCSLAGRVSFQDHPCEPGETQRIVPLAADPTPAPAASLPPAPSAPPAQVAPAATLPSPAVVPAPDFFLCTRSDGSRYASDTGVGGRTAVPYAMLGGSGQDLAGAYGGRNGIGVSAPGLRTPPRIPAARAPLAGAYVWIDDECHHADPAEACAWLREQIEGVTQALRRAFSDTEASLQQRRADLEARAQGCP